MEKQLKATELRCGNLIYRYDKIVYTNIGILTKIQNGSVIYKPIQLTEDILVKLGFEPTTPGYWNNGILEVGYTTSDEYIQYEFISITHKTKMVDLKFLHCFQNLYFSLTGEELTFKN